MHVSPILPCVNNPNRHPIRDDIPFEEPLRFAAVELTSKHSDTQAGHSKKELTAEQWLSTFAALRDLGCLEITMAGGEVFLRRDWLELARAILRYDMKLAIETAGLLIDDEIFCALRSLPGVILGIRLDAATPARYRAVHGSDYFEKVCSVIKRIRDHEGMQVNVMTSFSQNNLGDVAELSKIMQELGVTWQARIAQDALHLLSRQQYRALVEQLADLCLEGHDLVLMDDLGYFPLRADYASAFPEWSGCQAGTKLIGIRSNGDVVGCLSLSDDFIEDNVRETPLEEVWCSPTGFHRLRQKAARLTGVCRTCAYSRTCRGGCAATAFATTRDILDNPLCLRRLECEEILRELKELPSHEKISKLRVTASP